MKLFLFFAGLFIFHSNVNSQMGSWEIKINNKTIISTATEDEKANCKKLKASDLKKNGNLEIIFKENEPNTWIRTFLLNDEDDNELTKIEDTTHGVISIEKINSLFKEKKKVVIYTVIAPIDPSIAIRIRRVHLYTFILP